MGRFERIGTPAAGPCGATAAAASAAIDLEETPAGVLALQRHRRDCPDCESHAAGLEQVAACLDTFAPVVVPAEESDRLLAAIRARIDALPVPARQRRAFHLRLVGGGAVAIAALAGLGRWLAVAGGGLGPEAWKLPLPWALVERVIEVVAQIASRALEGLARILMQLPEIGLPAPHADFGLVLPIVLLSLLVSSATLFVFLARLFWFDLQAAIGLVPRPGR